MFPSFNIGEMDDMQQLQRMEHFDAIRRKCVEFVRRDGRWSCHSNRLLVFFSQYMIARKYTYVHSAVHMHTHSHTHCPKRAFARQTEKPRGVMCKLNYSMRSSHYVNTHQNWFTKFNGCFLDRFSVDLQCVVIC